MNQARVGRLTMDREDRAMTKVIADITMSLDGYVTGAGADPQCGSARSRSIFAHTERRLPGARIWVSLT